MESGALVPDELICNVVCERLQQEDCIRCGWLLDGFPRTRAQADALSAAVGEPDLFLLLDVPEEILVERVTGRRTDPVTGLIYHLRFNPPPPDVDPARLVQRSDDTAETIVKRYREFAQHVDSVQSAYSSEKVIRVDGSLPQDAVTRVLVTSVRDTLQAKQQQQAAL